MKIHHVRNATFVIESDRHHILVDPMLGYKGSLPPFAYLRHRPRRNPLVALPENAAAILDDVTHCLVTHRQKWGIPMLQHTDHLDADGEAFLRVRQVPVATPKRDAACLKNKELNVLLALDDWQTAPLLGGEITPIPARHGRGWMHRLMANGAGFFLRLPREPSLYISGDTVYTEDVERVLTELKPDIAVVACGRAGLDVGGPILMTMKEILTFVEKAPRKVIANHLEVLNQGPTTRLQLRKDMKMKGVSEKVLIPDDGESIDLGKRV